MRGQHREQFLYQGLCKLLSFCYVILWFISNIGIILSKVWDESCEDLFIYLLLMSFICLGGVIIYLYLGLVRYGSDTQWLLLSLTGAVCSIMLTIFLCWGGVRLLVQSGLLGVDQCFDCMYTNGTAVTGKCLDSHSCLPSSWKVIKSASECTPAAAKDIDCELTNLCYYSASHTFYYSVVTTGFYVVVLFLNGSIIFTQMIPSLVRQSTERSRLM